MRGVVCAVAVVAAGLSAAPAAAQCASGNCAKGSACNGRGCPGHKPYPFSDYIYHKKFCGPTINPGACFGMYRTQWRSWHEACGEPEPFNPGPQTGSPATAAQPSDPMPPPMPTPETAPVPKKPDDGRPATPIVPKAPLTPPGDKPADKKPGTSGSVNPQRLPLIPVVPTGRRK